MKCLFVVVFLKCAAGFPSNTAEVGIGAQVGVGGTFNKQVNFGGDIFNLKANALQQTNKALAQLSAAAMPGRVKGREEAVLEGPNPLDLKDSFYDKAQQAVVNFLHPRPIVDTIREEDKYGNQGDQFRPIGNKVVDAYEGFSNFLNVAADLPFEFMRQITKKVSSNLGVVGAKLVGL